MLLNLLVAQQCLLLHYPALCLKLLRTAERQIDAYPTLRRSSLRWFAKRLLERPRKMERAELHDSANWRARSQDRRTRSAVAQGGPGSTSFAKAATGNRLSTSVALQWPFHWRDPACLSALTATNKAERFVTFQVAFRLDNCLAQTAKISSILQRSSRRPLRDKLIWPVHIGSASIAIVLMRPRGKIVRVRIRIRQNTNSIKLELGHCACACFTPLAYYVRNEKQLDGDHSLYVAAGEAIGGAEGARCKTAEARLLKHPKETVAYG
jgi:hypothetical protein